MPMYISGPMRSSVVQARAALFAVVAVATLGGCSGSLRDRDGCWTPECRARLAEQRKAQERKSLPPPQPRLTPEQVSGHCKAARLVDASGAPRAFQYHVDCPLPQGFVMEDIQAGAIRYAAIYGALLESDEFMVGRIADPPAGWFRLFIFYAPTTGFFEGHRAEAPKEFMFIRPAQVLPPALLADIQERIEAQTEDTVYADCKALVMNIDAATKDPQRSQACATTMGIIDRARSERRARKERDQDLAIRQAELAEARRQRELDRQAIEHQTQRLEEMERQRRRAAALQSLGNAFKQTTTRCQPDFLGGVKCTTTNY